MFKRLDKICNWTLDEEAVLTMSSRKYHAVYETNKEYNVPLIFGEYFFFEAVAKLKDENFMLW